MTLRGVEMPTITVLVAYQPDCLWLTPRSQRILFVAAFFDLSILPIIERMRFFRLITAPVSYSSVDQRWNADNWIIISNGLCCWTSIIFISLLQLWIFILLWWSWWVDRFWSDCVDASWILIPFMPPNGTNSGHCVDNTNHNFVHGSLCRMKSLIIG